MEQALEGADAVHRVSEFTHYTQAEGEYPQPWKGGKIDGRSLKKRDKFAVKINGIMVHALGNGSVGMLWDCVNGFRSDEDLQRMAAVHVEQDAMKGSGKVLNGCYYPQEPDEKTQRAIALCEAAQAYALRIWDGQSVDVSIPDRVERVVNGLRGQSMSIDVTLPHPDAARFLAQHA